MHSISIKDAIEGMVVGKDILSTTGKCLVSKGTVLTDSLIKGLISHGINIIYVQSEKGEENSLSEEEILIAEEKCKEKVLNRFCDRPTDSMMMLLFKTALRIEAIEYLKCQKDR